MSGTRRKLSRYNRCHYDGKWTYASYERAAHTAAQADDADLNVYWCARAGGYHLTTKTRAEYNRRQAAAESGGVA